MKNNRLRHRIALQRNAPAVQGFQGATNWQTYTTVDAEKRDPKPSETQDGIQTRATMTVIFKIYARDDISTADRVLYGARIFDVIGMADPDGRGRWLFLYCQEKFSDGD